MAGPVVEFLAPPPFLGRSMLQFWVRGGNVSFENAARIILEAYFDDHVLFFVNRAVEVFVFLVIFGTVVMHLICMAMLLGWTQFKRISEMDGGVQRKRTISSR
jgi:hypothetical protein